MSNLAQRTLTALLGAILALAALWVGGWVFAILVAAAAAAAQWELYGLLKKSGAQPFVWIGLVLGAIFCLRAMHGFSEPALEVGGGILLFTALFSRRETPLLNVAGTALGVVYPAALLGSILFLRGSEESWLGVDGAFWITASILFAIWGADTAAYFAGRSLGRRKLMPAVSPNKTWEGAIGGALGALCLTAAFKLVVLSSALAWTDVIVLGIICGVAGPLGDLAESHFKRSADVKDSGTWIPGHGGMLDRLDAALVAVPLAVAYLELAKGL